MPNRADHSVKNRPLDGGARVKRWVLIAGSAGAGLGALAVIVAGGPSAALLASGILTILIFLQIFLLVRDVRAPEPAVNSKINSTTRPTAQSETMRAPILVINVSDLGRVRSIWGCSDLVSGLQTGKIIDELLPPGLTQYAARRGADELKLDVLRYETPTGQVVILAPASDTQAAVDQQLIERTNFFAGLGHDLKSPLNAVIGFADIMDAEIRGPMPDAYRDYPGLIRESGETLLRLVEDILGYARSEAGTFELDLAPMDVAASGESVLRQNQAMAEKANVRLKFDTQGEVLALCDADAVRRIWDNLVSNAIKYSSAGDTVTLKAGLKAGQAIISVTDTGAGMDADDLARVAAPFAQGRNAKGRAGTGLGLALVHRLADLHGGQVKIETALGRGTTVTVTLPGLPNDQKRAAE